VKKKHNFPRSASPLKMDFGWKMLARILPDPGPKHGPLAFFSGGHSWIFSGNVLPIENLRGKIGQNLPTLDTPDHWLRLDVLDVRSYDSDHHAHPQARSIHCRCARNEGITRPSSLTWLENPHPH